MRYGMVACVVVVGVLGGCAGATEPTVEAAADVRIEGPAELVLAVGEERPVGGSALRVRLAGILEDSRCPTDVTCVWPGNVRVALGLSTGAGSTTPVQLNTALEPRIAEWHGVRFTVVEVRPDPVSTDPISTDEYRVTVRVEQAP
ncbi:MAG: hypothetical protein KC645_09330 [Gemmatimonadetes bacterium]|nr:hypothetical protein [Gemmatimonadota bacterium]